MSETIYKTKGIVEVGGHEFEYSATLYFNNVRRPDEVEIDPVNEGDKDMLSEIWETVQEEA